MHQLVKINIGTYGILLSFQKPYSTRVFLRDITMPIDKLVLAYDIKGLVSCTNAFLFKPLFCVIVRVVRRIN